MIIKIDGVIGLDVGLRGIDRQLSRANGEDVVVEMSSPGGSISEGLKIFNALKNYQGNLTFLITGLAASMATYIMFARGKDAISVEQNAIIMIHNASGVAWGDYRDMAHTAKLLDDLTGHLAKVYSENTGMTVDEIRTMLDAETYIYGDDIVNQGFAGTMVESGKKEDMDENGAIALAKMSITECMAKVKSSEMTADDYKELTAMVMSVTAPQKPPKAVGKIEPIEENNMDLKELQAKYPDLCNTLAADGHAAGVTAERERSKGIVAFRGKFPKFHKVIDDAIAEGHDLTTLNLNIMAAQSVSDEVAAAGAEGIDVPAGGNADTSVPDMVNGEMTTPDHLDSVSKNLAAINGLTVQ